MREEICYNLAAKLKMEDAAMVWTRKVSAKGVVTIPAEIRRLLGLVPGSEVVFLCSGPGSVVMVNAEDLSKAATQELRAEMEKIKEKDDK